MPDEYIQGVFLIVIYRISTVAAGLAIVFMGYRLFRVGVFERAGDLKASWGEKALVLKQAAPGTFFALFGAFIICLSVSGGLKLNFPGENGGIIMGAPAELDEYAPFVTKIEHASCLSNDSNPPCFQAAARPLWPVPLSANTSKDWGFRQNALSRVATSWITSILSGPISSGKLGDTDY